MVVREGRVAARQMGVAIAGRLGAIAAVVARRKDRQEVPSTNDAVERYCDGPVTTEASVFELAARTGPRPGRRTLRARVPSECFAVGVARSAHERRCLGELDEIELP